MIDLQLPSRAVSERFSRVARPRAGRTETLAELEGPGCIRHIWMTSNRRPDVSREAIVRIWFDDADTPHVEAPLGDLFGCMHGQSHYPVNTHHLSVLAHSGYNIYFPMPFARSARIEVEPLRDSVLFMQVDWHRYPEEDLVEPMRFCCRFRRENPTPAYAEDYLLLDADGPGQLAGFAYGVRLIDNEDRWSHGGADNIYIDGLGDYPAYLRGIGGEDTFGTSYGGNQVPPATHHYASMPWYTQEDIGQARLAPRLVGYRFFEHDTIRFERSIHVRFGCMRNDICSTAWWYQHGQVRPFFRMPGFDKLTPGSELVAGDTEVALPVSGSWWLCGPFDNRQGQSAGVELEPETVFDPATDYDGRHAEDSPWLNPASVQLGRDRARWKRIDERHGFVDIRAHLRPRTRGVSPSRRGVALLRCVLECPVDAEVTFRMAWDGGLSVRLDGGQATPLQQHTAFRQGEFKATLCKGLHTVVLRSEAYGEGSHGGWVLAFRATVPDGRRLRPQAEATP